MTQNILMNIGPFSDRDVTLFQQYTIRRSLDKNELLLTEGEVCQSVFYVLSGAFCQLQNGEIEASVVDLHVQDEWIFNHTSLISQQPSQTSLKAFANAEVVELSLRALHDLIGQSKAFLQFGRILNPDKTRTYFFDNALNPAQKYNYLLETKPLVIQTFPIKLIAAYLKVAPETLSRVRANFKIS